MVKNTEAFFQISKWFFLLCGLKTKEDMNKLCVLSATWHGGPVVPDNNSVFRMNSCVELFYKFFIKKSENFI